MLQDIQEDSHDGNSKLSQIPQPIKRKQIAVEMDDTKTTLVNGNDYSNLVKYDLLGQRSNRTAPEPNALLDEI